MGNMHLVTGYQGQEHVTAADHGSLYAAIFGSGNYVLYRGNKLAASLITSNQVRIADGDLVMQGRHIRLNEGGTVDLTIENGAQGYKRNDLIVARYTRNASTGVEEANLVVIKGTAVESSPTDPECNNGDILNDHAEIVDFPLYRIPLDGVTVGTPVQLFDVVYLVTMGSNKKVPTEYLPAMNYIPTSQKGAASGVASLGSDGKVPSSQLPSMNYIPTSQKGAASGVAPLNSSKKIDETYLPDVTELTVNMEIEGSGVTLIHKNVYCHKYGKICFIYASFALSFAKDTTKRLFLLIENLPEIYYGAISGLSVTGMSIKNPEEDTYENKYFTGNCEQTIGTNNCITVTIEESDNACFSQARYDLDISFCVLVK